MSELENKILSNQNTSIEGWNQNDASAFKSMSVKNFIRNTNGVKTVSNQGEYVAMMDMFHTAFSDFKVNIDDYFIKDGKSFVNWTVTATNTGEFMENPPTGKKIKTQGYSIWSYNTNGEAIQEDAYYDNMELYSQMGYTVSPPE